MELIDYLAIYFKERYKKYKIITKKPLYFNSLHDLINTSKRKAL